MSAVNRYQTVYELKKSAFKNQKPGYLIQLLEEIIGKLLK